MFSYYSSIILLSWMTLGALCILVHENGRISLEDKRILYITYALIAVSALAEWIGVQLSGNDEFPTWMLQTAKCWDYILTPMAGAAIVTQMHLKNALQKVMYMILGANMILQILTIYNGGMIVIDENGHYLHGPLYPAYMFVCIAIIVILIIQFLIYGGSYRRQNQMSLYAIMLIVVIGILIQEALPGSFRTSYIALTLGAALMFIHTTEFTSMDMEDTIANEQKQLETDPLTGVLSRYAYIKALKAYNDAGPLPEFLASYTIDINGLKEVNDSLGHDAGDELICGTAECISRVFTENSKCFRTGGDEFVVFAEFASKEQAQAALEKLKAETASWRGKEAPRLELSAGCSVAGDNPGITADRLVRESDFAMYDAKAEYYRRAGVERRRIRR